MSTTTEKGGKRILVVDDERGIRDLLTFELSGHGFDVVTAPDGEAGVAAARAQTFDVAVIDVSMPKMNGLDTLRALKAIAPQTEAIMMTGHATLETALESMKRGAYDYITKPFEFEDLNRLVERALEKRRLNQKVDQLQELNRLKSEFLANMSHELRTPMNAIIGYTSLILDKTYGEVSDKQANGLRRVEANAKNLLDLINNVLDFSKISAGRMPVFLERFDLRQLIREGIETMEALAREKGIYVRFEPPAGEVMVRSDKTKIKQVLINLVANGVKFTEEGGVTVSIETPAEGGAFVHVKDTGIGIAPEDQAKLFQEFKQLDSSATRQHGGTGLGLSICRKLTELLGGNVSVQSEPGKGSDFIFVIPLERGAEAGSAVPANVTPPEGAPREVLLAIDDDPEVLTLLRDSLQGTGIHFLGAQSGDEGLALARKYKPFVITLDIMMPHRDGWSVLQAIKGDPELRGLPVVIVSIVENKALAFSLGVADYLVKPFSRQELLEKIEQLKRGPAKKILVVDDDPIVTELLEEVMKVDGYEVETCNDGRATMDRIARGRPDVLFLDLMMPDTSGFDILEQIAKDSSLDAMRVIVITAKHLSAAETELLERRAEMVVQKGSQALNDVLRHLRRKVDSPEEAVR